MNETDLSTLNFETIKSNYSKYMVLLNCNAEFWISINGCDENSMRAYNDYYGNLQAEQKDRIWSVFHWVDQWEFSKNCY